MGARLVLPWPREFNALVYVLAGRGAVGTPGAAMRTGNMVVFGEGDHLTLSADADQDSHSPQLAGGTLARLPISRSKLGRWLINR